MVQIRTINYTVAVNEKESVGLNVISMCVNDSQVT